MNVRYTGVSERGTWFEGYTILNPAVKVGETFTHKGMKLRIISASKAAPNGGVAGAVAVLLNVELVS